ncbi:hypothetical protein ACWGDT_23015 [Streptomyces avermitilis]
MCVFVGFGNKGGVRLSLVPPTYGLYGAAVGAAGLRVSSRRGPDFDHHLAALVVFTELVGLAPG